MHGEGDDLAMTAGSFRFDRFVLDARNRRLWCDDRAVAVNARYLDALVLLVAAGGDLVSKDRFLEEVWRGVPVTDEALTQCIRTLRRLLGDEATRPRFIETVPKHGYRFIAPVAPETGEAPRRQPAPAMVRPLLWGIGGAGIAGLIGGLVYGLVAASPAVAIGAGSSVLVLASITVVLALIGGAGVSAGIVASRLAVGDVSSGLVPIGGMIGGLIVGGLVKLLGMDAFQLLVGQRIDSFTGALEGALLGGGAGLGCWLADRRARSGRGALALGALGGLLGAGAVVLTGGRLMAGSLDLLAGALPGSRVRMDAIGWLLGEPGFGPIATLVTALAEGALFGGCVTAAMWLSRRTNANPA